MRTVRWTFTLGGAVVLAAGCSLINSFDDVVPQADETGGSPGTGGKTGGTGGSDASADGGSGGASTGGTSATGGTTTDGGGGGTPPGSGGAATGGSGEIKDSGADVFIPGGNDGVIVAYYAPDGAAPSKRVLAVLSPVDGAELSSEPMGSVRGIANDVQTDLWYVFEATSAAVTDPLTLHVRELNTKNGRWREVATVKGVPVPSTSRPQALNGRLAYLSTPPLVAPDPANVGLTVLNTQNPGKIAPLTANAVPLPQGVKQGLLGAPTSAIGGVLSVIYLSDTCAPVEDGGTAVCDVNVLKYSVTNTVVPGTPKSVGKILPLGNPSFTLDPRGPSVVMALPVLKDNTGASCTPNPFSAGSLLKVNMNDLAQIGATVTILTSTHRFGGSAAYDPCLDAAYLTSAIADKAIWSAPFASGGTVDKQCVAAAGGALLLEPYTRTLIRAVAGGSAAPEFYSLTGTAAAPKVAQKSMPKLPKNFAPVTMSVREIDRDTLSCPK
jgi:hypothetical protein